MPVERGRLEIPSKRTPDAGDNPYTPVPLRRRPTPLGRRFAFWEKGERDVRAEAAGSAHCDSGRLDQPALFAESFKRGVRRLEESGCTVEVVPGRVPRLRSLTRRPSGMGAIAPPGFATGEDCCLRFTSAEVAYDLLHEVGLKTGGVLVREGWRSRGRDAARPALPSNPRRAPFASLL